ncbi:hypothetical protein ACU4GD_17820 [Cupriavidus basilensis]
MTGHAAPECCRRRPVADRQAEAAVVQLLLLTVGLMVLLILGTFPLPALFIVASAIALMVNYPSLQEQKEADRARMQPGRRAGNRSRRRSPPPVSSSASCRAPRWSTQSPTAVLLARCSRLDGPLRWPW